ncbi:hypothetical protein NDK47_17865 [Brevibacillus ruminantium]|uniref:Uncharacterized protein n=1 Tax=Brevibacillus ruminantium TaxID=2950604 RepID=A0ABY4WA05_9BACL|nr:hypothetical protein [Brevibacillus ruminantium]USG64017.1 hypothetical protein NDK47_17865 [Brevibacillus ruminantium]
MNLQLSITKGDTSASLMLENTSSEYATSAINKIFGFFSSGPLEVPNIVSNVSEDKHKGIQTAEKPISKTIEKINSERTLMQPLAEKLSAALGITAPDDAPKEQPAEGVVESSKEDINEAVEGRWPYSKYRDGKEYFKCRYYCRCGHKANHYIEEDRKTVSCFDCKTTLAVREANEYEQQKLQTRFMATELVEQVEPSDEPEQQQSTEEQASDWKLRRCLSVKTCRDCGETIAQGERFDSYYQKGKSRIIVCPECYENNHPSKEQSA